MLGNKYLRIPCGRMDVYVQTVGWISLGANGLYWGAFLHEDYRRVAEDAERRGTLAGVYRGSMLLGVFPVSRRWILYYADGDPVIVPFEVEVRGDAVWVNGVEHVRLEVEDMYVVLHPELYEAVEAADSAVAADPLGCVYIKLQGGEKVYCRLRDQYPLWGAELAYAAPTPAIEYAIQTGRRGRVPGPRNEPNVLVVGDYEVDLYYGRARRRGEPWQPVNTVDIDVELDKPLANASFVLTFRCPRRCRHCLRQILPSYGVELSVYELFEKYSRSYRLAVVNINGGEPLLRIDELRDSLGLLDGTVRSINTSLALSTLSENDLAWLVDEFYAIHVGVHDSWFVQDNLNDVQLVNLGRVAELVKRYNDMGRPRRLVVNVQYPWHEFGTRVARLLGVPVAPATAVEGWDALSTRYAGWWTGTGAPAPEEEYLGVMAEYSFVVFPDGTSSYCVFQPRLPPEIGPEFSRRLWEHRLRVGGACRLVNIWWY